MKINNLVYFVEGEDEQKIVNTLKSNLLNIKTGKIKIFNVVEKTISNAQLMSLSPKTTVVLIFDTDTGNVNILNKNINILNNCSSVSKVITIPQVHNLEEELVCSCNIRKIKELLNSKSNSDFKRDIIKVSNLANKLIQHKFDIEKFWTSTPDEPYQNIENLSKKIKLN